MFLYNSNVLRTDGVDIEFIFDKTQPPRRELITPASFENWIEYGGHRTTIWGIDPGITDVIVAVDGHDEDRHRVRQTSSKEYYHLCGYNAAKDQRRRWEKAEGTQWNQLITQMPSLKTAHMDNLLHAIRYRLDNFADIVEPYDRDFRYRRLAFTSYKHQQRGLHEICRRLTYGSKKYGQNPIPTHNNPGPTTNVWRPEPPLDRLYEDENHHYLIAFGNASFGNMRGKRPAPTKKIFNHLKYLSGLPNRQIPVIKGG
jgi:hypothetical protein